jgi:hypothetical protein
MKPRTAATTAATATDHLREAIGEAAYARLVSDFGGRRLRVPRKHEGPLWAACVRSMGHEAAAALFDLFGGARLPVPMGESLSRKERVRRLAELRAAGASWDELQEASVHVRRHTVRHLQRLLAGQVTTAQAGRAGAQGNEPPAQQLALALFQVGSESAREVNDDEAATLWRA